MRRYFLVVTNALFFFSLLLVSLPTHAEPAPTPTPSPSAQPSNGFFSPGDSAHPVKLNFPFSWVGELKLPSRDEVASRDKLEFLDDLTDQQIRAELEKWQPYNNMSLGDQGRMLMRIQEFRDRRTKIAQDEALKLNLCNMAPADQLAFKKMFWQLQRQVDDELITEFQSQYDAKEHEMEHTLVSKFASLVPTRTPTPVKAPVPVKMAPGTLAITGIQGPVPTPSANVPPVKAPAPKVTPEKTTSAPKLTGKPKPTPTPPPKPKPPSPTSVHKPASTPSPTPTKHP